MKKCLTVLWCVLLIGYSTCVLAEYSPGCLMEPPREVVEHVARSFPEYELKDYCEVCDTPKGDFGFAMLEAGDERLLAGYEEKNGRMTYWLRSHGAIMQGSEEAWFDVTPKGAIRYRSNGEPFEADGLSFTITQLDDAGESYARYIGYHWEDGGFKLTGYHDFDAFYGGVIAEKNALHFHNAQEDRDYGRVYGVVQRDLRYVNFAGLPKTIEQAKAELSSAPGIVAGNFHPQTIRFTGGRQYAVYTGPGERYVRSGNGKGQVSTNDWIEVFGLYDGWIMIQYDISADRYRIGWIEDSALPKGAEIPELSFERLDQHLLRDCMLTDDPLHSNETIMSLKAGTPVTSLADFGEHFYIEVVIEGRTYWGFIDADFLTKG